MEKPLLTDADKYPAEELIFKHIGRTRSLWQSLFNYIEANYPDFKSEWRYYMDGKSWLMKVTRRSGTIFWLSVIKGAIRTTFYFTDKAKEAIGSSSLSDDLEEQFNSKSGLRGITVVFRSKKDVEYAKELIALKLSIK
jgi:hypothetical protein